MADLSLIKELRSITNAPLGDCKKALDVVGTDLTKAQERLKEKGILKASKKSDRETNEGIVKFLQKGDTVCGVKVLCETDFVAKNEKFHELIDTLLTTLLAAGQNFMMDETPEDIQKTLQNMLDQQVATIGESLRLVGSLSVTNTGDTHSLVYNHTGNKISSVIRYENGTEESAKLVALQLTAMNPKYVAIDDVPVDIFAEAKEKFTAELKGSNKPADIQKKIIEGKLYKEFKDDVLLEQESIKDSTKLVKHVIGEMKISKVLRIAVG